MSWLSGKCDLADHIAGMGGWYDKDGHPVKFGDENVHCYYSDLLQDFEAFKKATGGVIHQHIEMKVSRFNIEFLCKNIKELEEIKDNNSKVIGYKYWGKEYKTLKSLNSKHVYLDKKIELTDLLSFIKYLPYLVSSSCSSSKNETVYISKMSYVESEELDNYKYGFESKLKDHYEKNLSELYYNVVKNYYLYDLDNRKRLIPVTMDKLSEKIKCGKMEYYDLVSDEELDYLHPLKFVWKDGKSKSYWSNPSLGYSGDGMRHIGIDASNIDHYLKEDIENGNLFIEAVILGKRPLILQ